MVEFKVGDVVRVKGIAGPNMAVSRIDGPTYKLWYFRDGLLQEMYSSAEVLEIGKQTKDFLDVVPLRTA